MTTLELKKEFHDLIESISNEKLLLNFYDLLKNRLSNPDGKLWNTLSEEEQQELLMAFDESNDDKNLLGQNEIKAKHKKWLYYH